MEIVTPNLRIRPLLCSDAERLWSLDRDPEVMRYLGPTALDSPTDYQDRIKDWTNRDDGRCAQSWFLALELRRPDTWIGWLHLRPALDYRYAQFAGYQDGEHDLGYRLHRSHWGRGLATEAAAAVIRNARNTQRCTRVVASALIGNTASIRVMEKIGLVRESYYQLPGFDQISVRHGTPKPSS